jgi:Bifunctional DNA primase/polymerase, N-terminal
VDANGKLDKKPLVQHYMKMGVRASTHLTRKFASAQGIGITLGARNGIAVVDADTKDENVVADVLAYYGASPLIARSPSSGGFHLYYRHNGRQRRRIRDPYWRERGAPVDVLGNGFITAPASRSPKGEYTFVQGGLDDLQRLPILRASADKIAPAEPELVSPPESPLRGMREHDGRNDALFTAIGPIARDIHQACGTREQLLQIAREHNAQCGQPMEDGEVEKIVGNVWRMTQEGRNAIGEPGLFCLSVEHLEIEDLSAFKLFAFLRAHQGPHAMFWCSNGLAERFGWDRERMAKARRVLIEKGYLVPVKQAGRGHPALFKWGTY